MSNSLGKRLVSQNLIVSAAAHETAQDVDWSSIHDLSVFIDLFCLYDEICVLGRQAYDYLSQHDSDLIASLRGITSVGEFDEDSRVVETASAHLATFLGDDTKTSKYRDLFGSVLTPASIERAVTLTADVGEDLEMGKEWLQTLPAGADPVEQLAREPDVHRSTTFLVRSFLYVAYSDVHRIPFTPDSTRVPFLQALKLSEQNLRHQLLERLERTFQNHRLGDDFGLTRNITPLAAIVFDRSYPDRTNIARAMTDLRRELAPLRERLHKVEGKLFWGKRKDEVALSRKWAKVFQEIETQYGTGEGLLSVHQLLGFAQAAGNIADDPSNIGGWTAILGLPVEVIQRILARWPVIELHRLRKEIPASENLKRKAQRLFGDSLR